MRESSLLRFGWLRPSWRTVDHMLWRPYGFDFEVAKVFQSAASMFQINH